MKYKIEITEKMTATLEVNARSVTEALTKAERQYYSDKVTTDLKGVEFALIVDNDKKVKKDL